MILLAGAATGSAIALLIGLRALWNAWRIPCIERLQLPEPPRWPRLTVVVAARDEAATIEAAARTLLAQDYPDLELVFVDDRSSDATGAILDRLAGQEPRLLVQHVRALPPGWLGKPHALHQAVALAGGELLLFTDADIHFAPGLLRRAVSLVEARGLDHLSLGPKVELASLPMALITAVIGLLLATPVRPRGDGALKPGPSIGIGAFNLVRRSAFARTEGFPWLRMEVGDDMGLALLLRRHGARAGFALSRADLSLTWYGSFAEMVRGLEKNMFGGGLGYSYLRLVLLLFVLLLWAIGPLAGLFHASVLPLALTAYAVTVLAGLVAARKVRQSAAPALFWPLGLLLFGFILCRSAWHCLRNRGIVWRGTHYPVAELRAGRRLGPGARTD